MATAPRRTLLVVDDDAASCRLVTAIFASEGFHVLTALDGPTGLDLAVSGQPDVVLLDLHLPGLPGLQVLERLKAAAPTLPVVMLTASKDVKAAVQATRLGAFDYLTKPIDTDEIVVVVQRAMRTCELQREVEDLRRRVGSRETDALTWQMGPSAAIQQVDEQIGIVAESDFTVLILGETGTGKELIAQAIHQRSGRRRKPFVALDCGAIPEQLVESELFGHERGAFTGADRRKRGHFEVANEGTCLLDEVGNLPMNLQVKLLRVLESRQLQPVGAERSSPLDVRFIAATNHDLQGRIPDGQFRSDLYFRLAQYTISLPPLRERPEDIAHLAQRFLGEASLELRRPVQVIEADALDELKGYAWPGNVRELRNVVRQAVLLTKDLTIHKRTLNALMATGGPAAASAVRGPEPPAGDRTLKDIADGAARAAEHEAIVGALRTTRGNKSQAAKALKTDYKTLHTKMRQLGIEGGDFK